jgi:hypothetical protein
MLMGRIAVNAMRATATTHALTTRNTISLKNTAAEYFPEA